MSDADKELTEAIDAAISRHYDQTGDPTFVTGWVLVTAEINPTDDGISGIGLFYPNGSMHWPTALGIVEAARIRLHSQFAAE